MKDENLKLRDPEIHPSAGQYHAKRREIKNRKKSQNQKHNHKESNRIAGNRNLNSTQKFFIDT